MSIKRVPSGVFVLTKNSVKSPDAHYEIPTQVKINARAREGSRPHSRARTLARSWQFPQPDELRLTYNKRLKPGYFQ